jgi:hypothetical protein
MDTEGRETSDEWLRQVQSEIAGQVRMQLSAEVLVEFPVEVFLGHGLGYATVHMLGISSELEADLIQWLRWWQERFGPRGHPRRGSRRRRGSRVEPLENAGDRLCQRLKEELGPGFHVSRT